MEDFLQGLPVTMEDSEQWLLKFAYLPRSFQPSFSTWELRLRFV